MKSYPIMLDVRGRLVVVVGAGPVGLRKAQSLTEAGAVVRIISDRAVPADGVPDGAGVVVEPYRPEHLSGAMLVFACTSRRDVNAGIVDDARAIGVLANAADQPDACDFFAPATIRNGEVVIAVGTGGSAPALAGLIRDGLIPAVPERIGQFAAALSDLRQRMHDAEPSSKRRHELQRKLASPEGYAAFETGGPDALVKMLEELLA